MEARLGFEEHDAGNRQRFARDDRAGRHEADGRKDDIKHTPLHEITLLASIDSLVTVHATVLTDIATVFTPLRPSDSNRVVTAFHCLVGALFHPICPVFPAILPP